MHGASDGEIQVTQIQYNYSTFKNSGSSCIVFLRRVNTNFTKMLNVYFIYFSGVDMLASHSSSADFVISADKASACIQICVKWWATLKSNFRFMDHMLYGCHRQISIVLLPLRSLSSRNPKPGWFPTILQEGMLFPWLPCGLRRNAVIIAALSHTKSGERGVDMRHKICGCKRPALMDTCSIKQLRELQLGS